MSFIGLRSKMYSQMEGEKVTKKCKGITKGVIRKISHMKVIVKLYLVISK